MPRGKKRTTKTSKKTNPPTNTKVFKKRGRKPKGGKIVSKADLEDEKSPADIPNIITDGRNGIIFEEGNEKQLYASIIRMIRLEKNWTEMGKHGRDFVYENHDLNKVSRQLENLYDLAIDINNNLNTR